MLDERRGEAGLTLVEIAVATVVMTVISVVVVQMLRGFGSNSRYLHEKLQANSMAERVVPRVREDVMFSIHLFQEESASRDFLARIDRAGPSLAEGSRMPSSSSIGYFDVDPPNTVQAGNVLYLVRAAPHRIVDASADATPDLHRVDMRRFVVYFLSQGAEQRLDLNRWCSVAVGRYEDVASISDDARRSRVGVALRQDGVRFLWRAGPPAGDALYEIDENGLLAVLDEYSSLPGDPEETEWGILGTRQMAIGQNGAKPPYPVPTYARATSSFPHGFELKADGNGVGGLLWVRVTVASQHGNRRGAAQRAISYKDQ